jgi:hypothetical protein
MLKTQSVEKIFFDFKLIFGDKNNSKFNISIHLSSKIYKIISKKFHSLKDFKEDQDLVVIVFQLLLIYLFWTKLFKIQWLLHYKSKHYKSTLVHPYS